MKLFYYQRKDGANNFGDSLNPWLWNQLLPGVLDEDETTAFIGTGTLLNDLLPRRLPHARRIVVMSAGVGYEKGIPPLDESWHIYCVRGPLSAQKLGIEARLAVTDGAVLVRRLFKPGGNKSSRFAFIPHVHHANYGSEAWQGICEEIGFTYIDPRWSVEQVLQAISQTEILLAEAMHGAIVADALRVPWIPVCTSARILRFKWLDWCASVGVDYQPRYVAPLVAGYPPVAQGVRSSLRASRHWGNWLKQEGLRSLDRLWQFPVQGFTGKGAQPSLKNTISCDRQQFVATQLVQIARTTRPFLSEERQLERLTVELEGRLEQFKSDVVAGWFENIPVEAD
jgi:succinoglycan biosynthesis protein ExoV